MKRLYLLCVLLILALAGCQPVQPVATPAQAANSDLPPGPTKVYEMRMDAVDPPAQFIVTQSLFSYVPGAWSGLHTHAGQSFVTMLEGELTLRKDGADQIFKAGESWTDLPGEVHSVGNEGTENARDVVTYFTPPGAERTTGVGPERDDSTPGPVGIYDIETAAIDPAAEFEVIHAVLDFAPGAWTPPHTHGGQTFNMVLDGAITLRENGTERVYYAGQGWSDTPDQVHAAGNAGSKNARLFVTFLLPPGEQLTTVHADMAP